METGPVDFVIVTALKIERDAILKRLDSYNSIQEDFEAITYYYGYLTIPASGEQYTVVVIMLLDMGNDEAAVWTTHAIQRWQPANVLMVGIAGGVPKKVALGDVVVADFCYYYELAKRTIKGDQRRPKQFPSDRLLYGRAQAYEASEWKGEINVARPGAASAKVKLPEAHFGVIGSGEKVIADTKTLPTLLKECPKLLAIAMEGAGVARAATSHSKQPPRFLEVRSICDFADPKKNDKWQVYAANAAAAFTIGLLRSRPLPPLKTIKDSEVKPDLPIMVLCAQSLRRIGPEELSDVLEAKFKGRKVETVSLDFTDVVANGSLADPEAAARRLADPQGKLFGALARRNEAELVF
ncbi:MAG: 5'-methylthioadenosine/S-adenosylhomocysteine nucleosidase, partial [Ignavibacteria bacterium]|nr:5'-methylthioadenosine/S-adenosylhomocysteine nucleosidase [Ignavibacteria bacterium]